ncbi:permease [Bifidobacterium bifidum]|nr:permease [Bifidobacterium bifidum]ROV54334.1 permease [Bifidobacterium bifidum]THD79166.1 permease [Bifidobacterium bifidum]
MLNLATTLGQAVGPSITSAVKTVTGTFTAAFAISIVMAPCAVGFVLSLRKVR